MKRDARWGIGLGLAFLVCVARPAPQLTEAQYALFAGDFNGDERTDLLYIARSPDLPSGIALADASGAPQMGFQSWNSTYLGIYWSLDYIQPVIGDFNGDGQEDVLVQSAAEDPSYLILSNSNRNAGAIGQLLGISQAISPTAMGLQWPTRYHKLLPGDFDGDGTDDLLLQGTERGMVDAIVLADGKGRLFSRTSDECWTSGPARCWGDGELGFQWSTADSTLAIGDFNADGRDDVLVQGWPDVLSDASATPPWREVFAPLAFGTVFSQGQDKKGRLSLRPNQLWDVDGLGTYWSPMLRTAIVGDFSGDGRADVLLQGNSSETPNQLVLADANGQLLSAVPLDNEAAGWSADQVKLLVGRYGNSTKGGLYVQSLNGAFANGIAPDISGGGNMLVVPSELLPPEGSDTGAIGEEEGLGGLDGSGEAMALAAVTPPSPPSPPSAVGALPATANVTEKGAATYTIPIDVPAGTAGLTPSLALTYSSNSGNGLVGVGWSVTGLGTITRCPKTLAQDGVVQGVQLTTGDEYCLNGNRLRRVTGSQGQAGSEYRTEHETFSRVKVITATTTGPSKWEAWRKDGLIEEYGGTADSNIAILGNSSVYRLWALSRVRDRAQNYYAIIYTNNVTTTGSYWPAYIDYTGNSQQGTAAPYRIQFTYEARNAAENVVSYYMGGLVNVTQRLKQIDYRYSSAIKRKYVLAYETPADSFSSVSRLASVQQCSPTACMGATTFAWSDTARSGTVPTFEATAKNNPYESRYGGTFPWPYDTTQTFVAYHPDLNGDGIPDQIEQFAQGGYINGVYRPVAYNLYYRLGTSHGQPSNPATFIGSWGPQGTLGSTTAIRAAQTDINIDGMEDFAVGSQNNPHTWLHGNADGTVSFDSYSGWLTGTFLGVQDNSSTLFIDVDGDGYKDRISGTTGTNTTPGTNGAIHVAMHPHGDGDYLATQTWWTPPSGRRVVWNTLSYYGAGTQPFLTSADVDGDGRQDILVQVNGGWMVVYSNGTTGTTGELLATTTDSGTQAPKTPTALDVNGDGCTDLVYHSSSSWRLATSKCRRVGTGSLNTAVALPMTEAPAGAIVAASDVNGDGNQDIVISYGYPVAGTPPPGKLYLSTGTGFGSGATLPLYGNVSTSALIDLDGDSVPDATTVCPLTLPSGGYCDNSAFGMHAAVGPRQNLLLGATDGFGKIAQFSYAPLTNSSVYTRGPLIPGGETQNSQGSMYVAKTMVLSNGIGGTYTLTYRYSGAKRNVVGRGFLGFATREITDSRTGFVTTEAYENSIADGGAGWELVGMLKSRVVRQSSSTGPLIEESTFTNSSINPDSATNRKYPYVSQSVFKQYELTGVQSPYTTQTTTTIVDNYGTPYDVTTTTTEGVTGLYPGSSRTQRVYTPTANILNDTTNWCIARVQRVEETRSHTLTDGSAETRVSTQAWDGPMCRVTTTTLAPGSGQALTTVTEYDLFYNVKKTTVSGDGIPAARQPVNQFNYGTNGHLLQSQTVKINGVDRTTSFTWDIGLAVRLTQTDANLLVTAWQYDDFGREKLMTRPDLTSLQTLYYFCDGSNSYCGDGLLRYVVRKMEKGIDGVEINHVDQFYDVVGRVKYEQSVGFGKAVNTPELIETQTVYDSRGNVAQESNPYYLSGIPVLTTMSYDGLGRLTLTQRANSDADPTVISESMTYGGLTVTKTDALSRTQVTVSSAWDTILRATDEAGKHTIYTYKPFGELAAATDPLNNKSSITYNIRGFRTGIADPDKGTWTYTNDALGRALTQMDAKAQVTTFTYDEVNRIEAREDSPGGAANRTTWVWDTAVKGVGRLASVTSPGGYQETYTYDSRGRQSQVTTVPGTGAGSYVVLNTYDDVSTGKPLDVTYPASTGSPLKVRYAYQAGFEKSVTDWTNGIAGTVYWTAHTQDARGHLTKEVYGNNQIANLAFDQTTGRLLTIQTGAGGGAGTQNLAYAWDKVGNLSSRQDVSQSLTESFQYDAVYRLTNAQRNGLSPITVTYNDIGNITNKSDVGAYTYPAYGPGSVRPHAVTTAGGVPYLYDANGNMTSRNGATVTWSTYDYPTAINQAGGNSSSFWYGPDRQVYRQTSVDGSVTDDRIIIGGVFEKGVRTGGPDPGTEYRHFIQANGKLAAVVRRTASLSETYYLHDDHLGSVDVITKSNGAVELRTSFDAWGKRRGSNWTGTPSAADKDAIRRAARKGYTGHEQLDNLNLVHMGGRVYDPVIARFMSADPIIQDPYHSQSFNRYSYLWNNPLNATDPTGLYSEHTEGRGGCDGFEKAVGVGCDSNGKTRSGPQENGSSEGETASESPSQGQTGITGTAQKHPDGTPTQNQSGGQVDQVPGGPQEVTVTGTREREVTGARGDEGQRRGWLFWVVDIVTDLAPPISIAKGIYETIRTFSDPDASRLDRATAVAGMLPFGKLVKFGRMGVRAARGAAGGPRAGKAHTQAAKRNSRENNRSANDGELVCPDCGKTMNDPVRSHSGIPVDRDAAVGAHRHARSQGGDGATVQDMRNIETKCWQCNADEGPKVP